MSFFRIQGNQQCYLYHSLFIAADIGSVYQVVVYCRTYLDYDSSSVDMLRLKLTILEKVWRPVRGIYIIFNFKNMKRLHKASY